MKNLTQNQIETILRVAKNIAYKYTFGYYDVEDIEQECFLLAQEAVQKYDAARGSFENFLYTHLHNRLNNFLRKKYYRKDFECKICGGKDPNCESCERRRLRFLTKKHLVEPIDIDHVNMEKESSMYYEFNPLEDMELTEIFTLINMHLEIELRADYLRMLEGISISKPRRNLIEQRLCEILEKHGYEKQKRPVVED